MIKQELIEKISKYFKLTSFESEKIYNDVFSQIILGVKEDNIFEVENFGEFIVKYNTEQSLYPKNVEFLASSKIDSEINSVIPTVKEQETESTAFYKTPTPIITTGEKNMNPFDDELQKKRDEIINKISAEEKINSMVENKIEEPVDKISSEVKESVSDVTPNVKSLYKSESKTENLDDISKKTFSDYFTEVQDNVKEETHNVITPASVEFVKEKVIPETAVELHNQITNVSEKPLATSETAPNVVDELVEHRNTDNSYYIWYKDSEPSASDTETMSYEYELLYQATKEAEYKSKLRIYVSTFIIFFSIVLILLIFSPLIYKLFFKPVETEQPQTNETSYLESDQRAVLIRPDQTSTDIKKDDNSNIQTSQEPGKTENSTAKTIKPDEQKQNPPVTSKEEKKKQETPKPEIKTEIKTEKKTEPPPTSSEKLNGVTKNSLGWTDDINKVVYVQLENGKFTIQESAWDSDQKASKRINSVEGFNINGIKGNVVKIDLGERGVWFRARFGEFTTLEEAQKKAGELRHKERIRLQAFLLAFLLYA